MRAAASCLVAAVICVACATPTQWPSRTQSEPSQPAPSQPSQPTPSQPRVNLSGYSAAFRAGYSDGCASAGYSTRRDEQRYRVDTDYAMGWNDGRSMCARR